MLEGGKTKKKVALPASRGNLYVMKIFPIIRVAQSWGRRSSLALVALSCASAQADQQLLPWRLHHQDEGIWKISAEGLSFGTSSNFGPSGQVQSVSGLDGLRRTEAAATIEMAIHPRLTLYGRGSWNLTDVRSTSLNASQFGLADQSLGLALRLVDSSVAVDFQIQTDLPVYNNTQAQAEGLPFLGDSSSNLHIGGFASLPITSDSSGRSWRISAGAGYTMRNADFSSSVPWSLELASAPAPEASGLVLRVLGWGFASLNTDPNAANPLTARQQGSGGSLLVNAVNPSLSVARGEFGYQWDSGVTGVIGASQTLWGQAVARGMSVHAGLEWRIDRLRRPSKDSRPKEQAKTFLTYTGKGKVKAVSSTRTLIIDQGSHQGLALGDRMDIFTVNPDGSLGQPVARAEVSQLDWEQAQLTILQIFKETAIKEGFAVQKLVQP
jgi:hypothetical protein